MIITRNIAAAITAAWSQITSLLAPAKRKGAAFRLGGQRGTWRRGDIHGQHGNLRLALVSVRVRTRRR